MSGPYADINGQGSVHAVQMAIEDFGGEVLGKKIELVYADHQNKADIGANAARQWFDQAQVDVVINLANSAVALAVQGLAARSEERGVGKECVRPCSTRWWPDH